jgi:hypothetical protein
MTVREIKDSTPPTPPMMPSTTRERKSPSGKAEEAKEESWPTPASIQARGKSPSAKVRLKMAHIPRAKSGRPVQWPMRRPSMSPPAPGTRKVPRSTVSATSPCTKA